MSDIATQRRLPQGRLTKEHLEVLIAGCERHERANELVGEIKAL